MTAWMQSLLKSIRKEAPKILTGLGITMLVGGGVAAVAVTPEAMRKLDALREQKRQDAPESGDPSKLTVKEMVTTAGPCYFGAIALGATGAVSIVAGCYMQDKRIAAIAATATVADVMLQDYKNKVIELTGEEKAGEIRDAVAQTQLDRAVAKEPKLLEHVNPDGSRDAVTPPSAGMSACYDMFFGKMFYSDRARIDRAINELNRRMTTQLEPYVSVNDFYDLLGVSSTDGGDLLGWNSTVHTIQVEYSSILVAGQVPCLAISYTTPVYDYDKI